jgi:hypothetical protein
MFIFWRTVESMQSVRRLHQWLGAFGSSYRVGDLKRIEKFVSESTFITASPDGPRSPIYRRRVSLGGIIRECVVTCSRREIETHLSGAVSKPVSVSSKARLVLSPTMACPPG